MSVIEWRREPRRILLPVLVLAPFRIGLWPDRAASTEPIFPFVFEEVIGIELTNAFEFDTLIGMDILRQCDFEMRWDGSCRLGFGA